jgi:hypothetical protein
MEQYSGGAVKDSSSYLPVVACMRNWQNEYVTHDTTPPVGGLVGGGAPRRHVGTVAYRDQLELMRDGNREAVDKILAK